MNNKIYTLKDIGVKLEWEKLIIKKEGNNNSN